MFSSDTDIAWVSDVIQFNFIQFSSVLFEQIHPVEDEFFLSTVTACLGGVNVASSRI